jgi:dsDNA-specific endonuclease/ATPase MutS2
VKEIPNWRLAVGYYDSLLLRVYYFEELKAAKPTVLTECEALVADACMPILDTLVDDSKT